MRLGAQSSSVEVQSNGRSCQRPDCDLSDDSEFLVIEKILGRALAEGKEEGKTVEIWLVKWEGYDLAIRLLCPII